MFPFTRKTKHTIMYICSYFLILPFCIGTDLSPSHLAFKYRSFVQLYNITRMLVIGMELWFFLKIICSIYGWIFINFSKFKKLKKFKLLLKKFHKYKCKKKTFWERVMAKNGCAQYWNVRIFYFFFSSWKDMMMMCSAQHQFSMNRRIIFSVKW